MMNSTQQNDANGGTPLAEPTGSAFGRARLNDVTVAMMLRAERPLEEIIGALADEKERYVKRIIELESIAPRKIVMPDGKVMMWQCPAKLVPPCMPNHERRGTAMSATNAPTENTTANANSGCLSRLVRNYIRFSPRAKGFPKNFDLDVWKFGISVCWWRVPKVFVTWARDWKVGDDPHCIQRSRDGKRHGYGAGNYGAHWYLVGVSLGGRWGVEY